MAFRIAFEEVRRSRRFMARIIELTCILSLSGDALQELRDESARIAAQLEYCALARDAAAD